MLPARRIVSLQKQLGTEKFGETSFSHFINTDKTYSSGELKTLTSRSQIWLPNWADN